MKQIFQILLLSTLLLSANANANWFTDGAKALLGLNKKVPKKKIKPKAPSATKIAITTVVTTALLDAGLNELQAFPVTPEIVETMKEGHITYQTRVCIDDSGNKVPVPKRFLRCPFGKEAIQNGPILNLN